MKFINWFHKKMLSLDFTLRKKDIFEKRIVQIVKFAFSTLVICITNRI